MKKHLKSALLLTACIGVSAIALSACGTSSPTMRHEVTERLGSPAWMVERQVPAGPFALTVRERMHERLCTRQYLY